MYVMITFLHIYMVLVTIVIIIPLLSNWYSFNTK